MKLVVRKKQLSNTQVVDMGMNHPWTYLTKTSVRSFIKSIIPYRMSFELFNELSDLNTDPINNLRLNAMMRLEECLGSTGDDPETDILISDYLNGDPTWDLKLNQVITKVTAYEHDISQILNGVKDTDPHLIRIG